MDSILAVSEIVNKYFLFLVTKFFQAIDILVIKWYNNTITRRPHCGHRYRMRRYI